MCSSMKVCIDYDGDDDSGIDYDGDDDSGSDDGVLKILEFPCNLSVCLSPAYHLSSYLSPIIIRVV